MKIDRHISTRFRSAVKLGLGVSFASSTRKPSDTRTVACLLLSLLLISDTAAQSQPTKLPGIEPTTTALATAAERSQPKAIALLRHTIDRLANGPAFHAKVRQRVWTAGREAKGIGTYEQAGYGSGRFNLQIAMHDGTGKHTLQQICDGRLAWTRTVIADQVSLRRVDVGRLDEWIPADAQLVEGEAIEAGAGMDDPARPQVSWAVQVPARLKVGAWTEMLDTIQRDHVLRLGTSEIDSRPVLVITGVLRAKVRDDLVAETQNSWPEMYPTTVKVAIATMPDPETGFGEGLPLRFEFWNDLGSVEPGASPSPRRPRLVTLIELYAIHAMTAPPVQRFRFENQDADVNFINETDRYLQRYGVRITDSQRRLLMR